MAELRPKGTSSLHVWETLERWFGIPLARSDLRPDDTLRRDLQLFEEIGEIFESSRAELGSQGRRDSGAYFTPLAVAERLVQKVIFGIENGSISPSDVTVCDPAAGAGGLLLPAVHALIHCVCLSSPELSIEEGRKIVGNNIYGIDVDPLTVAVLRSLIWMFLDAEPTLVEPLEKHIVVGDSLSSDVEERSSDDSESLDWWRAFPAVFQAGGFGAVIANPPWGTMRAMSTRWVPDSSRTSFAEYSSHRRRSTMQLHRAHAYKFQGGGDGDLYRYFLERCVQILSPRGTLGILVPGALLRTNGASPLRRYLLSAGTFVSVVEHLNTDRAFHIHPMFKYLEIVWKPGTPLGIQELSLGNRGSGSQGDKSLTLSRRYLQRVSKFDSGIPDIRTEAQKRLLLRLGYVHPPLGDRSDGGWNASFRREIDVTNAKQRFIHSSDLGSAQTETHDQLVPLYEGRMVHQHDQYAKAYLNGDGRSAKWEVRPPNKKLLGPQFYVPAAMIGNRGTSPRAGFCDITGHANERTVLSALLPGGTIAGNKVPVLEFDSNDPRLHLIWISIANSFVVDWLVRRRVSTTLNYFYWKQIPFPRVEPESAVGKELAQAALALSNWTDEDPRQQLPKRALIRARIDALVAHLYELDVGDMSIIFQDFPLVDKLSRDSPTFDLVVQSMQVETTISASQVSPMAYVPSEMISSLGLQENFVG